MTTRLTVICHAATEATRAARFPGDEDLDMTAAPAVSAAATHLGGHLLAGPERRVRRTAELLAAGASVAIDPALRDWDVGRWRGYDLAHVAREAPDALASWLSNAGAAPHGGESLHDLLARAEAWLGAMAGRGGRTLAVTHPPVLRAVIVQALGAGPTAFWRIEAPPLCRARLSHDGRRWVLQSLDPHPAR